MKKFIIIISMLININLVASDRPGFNPFSTIDWNFFADNFEWKTKLCSCNVGQTGLSKAGFEVSFYEPIGLVDITATPWKFPSFGFEMEKGMGRKQGVVREDESGSKGFRYTHFIIYPIFSVMNLITDYICFERLSVLSFGYMAEINPAWNNDTLTSFFAPEKLLFAMITPACIVDCLASTYSQPVDSMYFCAGCWEPIGMDNGWTPGSQPLTEAGTLATRMIDMMHRTFSMTKTSNAFFSSSTSDATLKSSMCQESFFPIILKSQYQLQLAYPVTWDTVKIGELRTPWADYKMGKDKSDDIVFWLWRKRDMCAGAYKCSSTFEGTKE